MSIRLIKSGFSFVDKNWGGVYRGGSYLVIGPRKSGRTMLSLQFAMQSVEDEESCLLFTNMRPKDLEIQAASLNFDLTSAMEEDQIIVVRISPPNYYYDMNNIDDYLIDYFQDIVTVVNQYRPKRIIFDEITHYIGFRNIELLRDSFLHTLETIEDKDITSLFIVGEPATQKAESLVNVLAGFVTGVITLKKFNEKLDEKYFGGEITITPNVGHAEGQFSSVYKIVPKVGLTVDFDNVKVSDTSNNEYIQKGRIEDNSYHSGDESERKIKEILPPKFSTQNNEPSDFSLGYSNVYEQSDFSLILNNQIALYQSTGQPFRLLSVKLNPAILVKGLLTANQFQTAVKKSSEKKDKICFIDHKVLVLMVNGNNQSVVNLSKNILNNLPSNDKEYIDAVSKYIELFNVPFNENIKNSRELMDFIVESDSISNNNYVPITNFSG